jgi:predicted nucleic acid-binding protein
MKPSVYLETSFISYLTGPLSQNMLVATHQHITREWWKTRRLEFELFISPFVVEEVRQGNATQSANRLAMLKNLPSLEQNDEVVELAKAFVQTQLVPSKVANDAYHIATATVHQLNYLLTWNCKHIANAKIQSRLRQVSQQRGYELPILCTPYELL